MRLERLGLISRVRRFDENGRQTSNEYQCTFIPIEELMAPAPPKRRSHIAEDGEDDEMIVRDETSMDDQTSLDEGDETSVHGGDQTSVPLTYPKECSPKERSAPAPDGATGRDGQQVLTAALREYFGTTEINGRTPDARIVCRIADRLGDVRAMDTFRTVAREWLLHNTPRTWAIFVNLAGDANRAWRERSAQQVDTPRQVSEVEAHAPGPDPETEMVFAWAQANGYQTETGSDFLAAHDAMMAATLECAAVCNTVFDEKKFSLHFMGLASFPVERRIQS